MRKASSRSTFFGRQRIQILMCALVAEMLASPLPDTHPKVGAMFGLAALLMVLAGVGHIANPRIVPPHCIAACRALDHYETRRFSSRGQRSFLVFDSVVNPRSLSIWLPRPTRCDRRSVYRVS
jgi:hypothetical protein